MTIEKNVMVRYSAHIDGYRLGSEEYKLRVRVALAGLFSGFARSLLNNEELDLTVDHIVELSSETEMWDSKLVLKLMKVEENDN